MIASQLSLQQLQLLPKLVQDYLSGKPELSRLYKYKPHIDSFTQIIADKKLQKTDRNLLHTTLTNQYSGFSASIATRQNIDALLQENTFTVTCAHQPILLLGPLYYIYKIACTIKLALELKAQYPDYTFVPVYWMGSEDHDWEELGNTYIFNKKIEWKKAAGGPVGRFSLDGLTEVLQEVKELFGQDQNAAALLQEIELAAAQYTTFSQLTHWLVNRVFAEYGLVILNQDDAALKRSFSAIIEEELTAQKAIDILSGQIDWLVKNYTAQAKPRSINFFLLGENQRERLEYNAETKTFTTVNTNQAYSIDGMKALIKQQPERFSPNVIYRPLFQEFILPNLAFVGGAAECSYWLQLKPLFEYYGVNYPAIVQRSIFLYLNSASQKKIAKLGLDVQDFFGNVDTIINKYTIAESGDATNIEQEKALLEKAYESLRIKALAADVTLEGAVKGELQKTLNSLEQLSGKILRAEKKKLELQVSQIKAVHAAIYPDGVLQERHDNFLPIYTRPGSTFIDETIRAINALNPHMLVLQE
jgi:bacillithiol biosynthesis cysteine-adding enzyme BshC